MKRSTMLAMSAVLLGCASAFAGKLPMLERKDLMACKSEILKLHELEIDFLADLEQNCSSEPNGDCSSWGDLKRQSIAADDFDWYLKGNDSCNGWDYPCYGPLSINDPNQTDESRIGSAKARTSQPPLGPPPTRDWDEAGSAVGLNYWSWAADICTAKVYLEKVEAAKTGDENEDDSNNAAAGDASAVTDANKDTRPADGGVHAAHCAEALAKQDELFLAMTRNAPKPGEDKSAGGAKALYQMGMYITDERLKVLDQFCKGEPQYATYPGVKASYDSALTGCQQLSSDGGVSCKPLRLW